tara:strand:+ start:109 stop:393 length:285 start_codon:yes stop_codon:yes gene_type:complete
MSEDNYMGLGMIDIESLPKLGEATCHELAWRVYIMNFYILLFAEDDVISEVAKMWDRFPSDSSEEEQAEWVAVSAKGLLKTATFCTEDMGHPFP